MTMAFLLNKTTIASHFRSHSQQKTEDLAFLWRRRLHIEPGPREKALLAEDSALKPFKSYKQSVKKLRRIGNVLTIVVVAVKDHRKVVSMPSIVKVPKCYVPQVPIPRVPVTEDFED